MKRKALFITRSDISYYSKNANLYQKPLLLSAIYALTLFAPEKSQIPREISEKCEVVKYRHWWNVFEMIVSSALINSECRIFTGFDFPCLILGWRLRKALKARWTVFCWDPPALTHRSSTVMRSCIDIVFRWFLRRCDQLVLNIHPGLLEEIGYVPFPGQLIQSINGCDIDWVKSLIISQTRKENNKFRIGVLSKFSKDKGGWLLVQSLMLLRRLGVDSELIWIGHISDKDRVSASKKLENEHIRFSFMGEILQRKAFPILSSCHVLVLPYLAVSGYKWNYTLKLFEYMALKVPIVASDNPGTFEVIGNTGAGLLFKSGYPNSLAEALLQIKNDKQLVDKIVKNEGRVVETYRWNVINACLSEALEPKND